MSTVWPYVAGILPTILVATLFYFLIKSMIEGDRRERIAQAKFEKEQDARARGGDEGDQMGSPPGATASSGPAADPISPPGEAAPGPSGPSGPSAPDPGETPGKSTPST